MSRCSIVDAPKIEGEAVVLRVIHEEPAVEKAGRVFVCRLTGFDEMTIETFPKGSTPQTEGDYRAEAAEFAKAYAEARVDEFEALFRELARRRREQK